MTDNNERLFKVISIHENNLSFEFESEELEIRGFYKWDGCFNYEDNPADGYDGRVMIHVCDINRMISFLTLLKEEARNMGFE